MNKYRVLLAEGSEFDFESKLNISTLLPIEVNGAMFIEFSDVEILLNLLMVKKIWFNGEHYSFSSSIPN